MALGVDRPQGAACRFKFGVEPRVRFSLFLGLGAFVFQLIDQEFHTNEALGEFFGGRWHVRSIQKQDAPCH